MSVSYRDTHAGDLTPTDAGRTVQLAGWADRIRDQGGVMFVDLRDASGIVQVVIDPETLPQAVDLRREFCISVTGEVGLRPAGSENPELPTGNVEVHVAELAVLSTARALPFQLDERTEIDELVRLQYRYLDMRRHRVAANLRARSMAVAAMRRVLNEAGFLDVETPTLIKSTPEGARDVLVPSRLQQGDFYALPQSPQLFKQLLMVGGVERYYQSARCYRDEDFRSDRQLEFSQLDIEGSFWGREDVLATIESVIVAVVAEVRGVELARPFPRLTYQESMVRFGTDKPDLRFGMEIAELTSLFAATGFKAFAGAVEGGGVIRGLNIGPAGMSRSALDGLVGDAKEAGAAGLVWMVVEDDGSLRSPVAKFLSDDELAGIRSTLSGEAGDHLLIVADRARVAAEVLGRFRVRFGSPADHEELNFLWVIDFPVFEETAGGDLVAAHHPFSAPVDVEEMASSPATAIAQAYDLVLNGSELGSGSVRIHDPDTQEKVFEILGISPEEAEQRFGWFVEALGFGTPPHAGFAVGIARLVSILQNEPNIREVIPFPKTQTGVDPLTGSPSAVDDYQLAELGIDLRPDVRAARLAAEESDEESPEGS
ncbi:MAG: aspartate--tRNA ligase [Acidimicrobiia bacterium]|nr:aspartate--tRNA ligase [Acidimicrobiia bacterium]